MFNPNTIFIGKYYQHLPNVDSTNLYLQQYLAKNAPIEGFVVWADYQSAGRGQLGSYWKSTAGLNLTTSFLLLPKWLAVKSQFLLSKAIALSIIDLLYSYDIPLEKLHIKWPNDIYVDNQKIAGILIENTLKGAFIEHAIVGIGLNINQTDFYENGLHATSIYLATKQKISIDKVLADLCVHLEQRYLQLKSKERLSIINDDYLKFLYRYQENALYQIIATEEILSGKIIGISAEGQLILNTYKGDLYFSIKELKFL